MQPRLVTLRGQQAQPTRRLSCPAAPVPAVSPVPWRITRRLATAGRLALFRAAADNGLGPGCYVLKTTRHPHADDALSRAMLQREYIVSSEIAHPNLNSVLSADFDVPQPVSILPYLEGISLRRLIASRSAAPH